MDQNFLEQPFYNVIKLLSITDCVSKRRAICTLCKKYAAKSQQFTLYDNVFAYLPNMCNVMIGAKSKYKARCQGCYVRGIEQI